MVLLVALEEEECIKPYIRIHASKILKPDPQSLYIAANTKAPGQKKKTAGLAPTDAVSCS